MTQETEREKFEAWAKSEDLSVAFDEDGYIDRKTELASLAWQARAALEAKQADHIADSGNMASAHENIREGAPYDCPAFEELARTMGVWGTAQAALCAQFWLKAKESDT